jgi:hypothetical protein
LSLISVIGYFATKERKIHTMVKTIAAKSFHLPEIHDDDAYDEIRCSLEQLEMCALYLSGEDQLGLKDFVERNLGDSIEDYDPEETYEKSLDNLVDAVGGYNQFIQDNNLSHNPLRIIVDKIRTATLSNPSEYQIYMVVA